MSFELLLRNAITADVKPKLRQIEVLAAPWEQETDVPWRGEIWHERYIRGAFNGYEDHAGRTSVNREHKIGDTVGKVVRADTQASDGMILTVQVAKTPRGDETLALAEEDMIGASLGYYTKTPSDLRLNRKTMSRDVLRAFVDHLSLVEQPAYEAARVLAVRDAAHQAAGGAPPADPLPPTPLLDELVNDELLQWAASRSLRA